MISNQPSVIHMFHLYILYKMPLRSFKCIGFVSVENCWQHVATIKSLHDLMLFSVTSFGFLFGSDTVQSWIQYQTWRQPNMSETCPSHWQLNRRSLVGSHNLDSGTHLKTACGTVSVTLSVSYIQTNFKNTSGAQGTTQINTVPCNIHNSASICLQTCACEERPTMWWNWPQLPFGSFGDS